LTVTKMRISYGLFYQLALRQEEQFNDIARACLTGTFT